MRRRVVIFRLPPFMRLWSFPHSSDDWWRLDRRHTCSILLHVNDAVDSRKGEQYDEPVELKSSVLENISDGASPLDSSNITCHQLHAHSSSSTYQGRSTSLQSTQLTPHEWNSHIARRRSCDRLTVNTTGQMQRCGQIMNNEYTTHTCTMYPNGYLSQLALAPCWEGMRTTQFGKMP